MRDQEPETRTDSGHAEAKGGSDSTLAKRYPVALALYGALAVLVWFTVGEGTIRVFGRQVEVRWVPILILGTFAFRTMMARQADRIRRGE